MSTPVVDDPLADVMSADESLGRLEVDADVVAVRDRSDASDDEQRGFEHGDVSSRKIADALSVESSMAKSRCVASERHWNRRSSTSQSFVPSPAMSDIVRRRHSRGSTPMSLADIVEIRGPRRFDPRGRLR